MGLVFFGLALIVAPVLFGLITETVSKVRKANFLRKCESKSCGKYSRSYQAVLGLIKSEVDKSNRGEKVSLIEMHDSSNPFYTGHFNNSYPMLTRCPHCEKSSLRYSLDDYPWLKDHPDAPVMGYIDYFRSKIRIKKILKVLTNLYSLQEYRKYNNI